jgi:hypothetical protein
MRIVTGVGDVVQMTKDCQAQVGYSVAEQSRGWVTLCDVCIVHEETRSVNFLDDPQNRGRQFISGLGSKPLRQFVSGLAPKPL